MLDNEAIAHILKSPHTTTHSLMSPPVTTRSERLSGNICILPPPLPMYEAESKHMELRKSEHMVVASASHSWVEFQHKNSD